VVLDAAAIAPQVSWGTSPEMVVDVGGVVPHLADARDDNQRNAYARALDYMGLHEGQAVGDIPLDAVFIGSCTNARIEDLRVAARIVAGRKVATNIEIALIVPGSGLVKAQAEAEGLDRIFMDAGVGRANVALPPQTAILKGGKGRARAPIWLAQQWRQRQRSPGALLTCGSGWHESIYR